ncbi:hypothetical protein [Singulisphaera acidiphila]|uniref:Uncharacterized protein n=1 Tax=Singulisphaera acidiphila (strain ATCC BAA-1392 / DSM 18658 / VKM B-2454 / MOB10) TaxID=886293 RepID=L0DRU1_SINAD|nr:hypothetical protein [Singulisphaera acidiphila]AGA31702.1 hypothetical protein Sinac_7673 [Singulisphaera acidiphila DSM 18658]
MRRNAWNVLAIITFVVSQGAIVSADEWLGMKEKSEGHTRAKGNVEYREETRAGKEFVVIKVNVWTKVSGQGKTGRGHAIYTVWKADGTPYKIIDSRKYASTGLTDSSNENHNETEVRFLKDSYFGNFDTDELDVFAEDKGGVPTSTSDLAKWIKEVAGPEIDKARLDVMKAAAGTIKEGTNWIVRKKK